MRAVIIGAGRGERLMPTTADTPKCFAEVGGRRILDWTLEAFAQNGVTDIGFIGGYQIERVRQAYPRLTLFHNAGRERNNILASLMCAEAWMDAPFVCCYSDILFTPEVVRRLLECAADIALVVDTCWLQRYTDRTLSHYEVVVGINAEGRRLLLFDPGRGPREDGFDGFTAEWAPGLMVFGIAPTLARELAQLKIVRLSTHPLVSLPLWLGTYFVWHVPVVYDAALQHQSSLLHVEHLTYLVAGGLMWWPVVHGRYSDGLKALYLFAAFVLAAPLGLLLALLPHPIYDFYKDAPQLWGLSDLTDQEIAGVTMAVEQAIVFFAIFAYYFSRFLRTEQIAGVFTERSR